jgi:hypothetical protein
MLGVLVALAVGAFFLGRELSGGESAVAGPDDAPVEPAAQDATGAPTALPAVPDTSKLNWAIPYMLAEDAKPRFNQVINGIAIGPTVKGEGCPGGVLSDEIPGEATIGSAVEISPAYLPDGAVPTGIAHYYACTGTPVNAQVDYYVAPDDAEMQRVSRGEMTFFDARHGGWFYIRREQTSTPIYFGGPIASERFHPASVLDYPAAIGNPIFEAGFGPAAVLVWDKDRQLLTIVEGTDLTVAELTRIAEGVIR